jgi:hypothetical protein
MLKGKKKKKKKKKKEDILPITLYNSSLLLGDFNTYYS